MWIKTKSTDGVTCARFASNEITDEVMIQQIGRELMDLVADPQTNKLVLSFESVQAISSAMIGKLVLLNKREFAGSNSSSLILHSLSEKSSIALFRGSANEGMMTAVMLPDDDDDGSGAHRDPPPEDQ